MCHTGRLAERGILMIKRPVVGSIHPGQVIQGHVTIENAGKMLQHGLPVQVKAIGMKPPGTLFVHDTQPIHVINACIVFQFLASLKAAVAFPDLPRRTSHAKLQMCKWTISRRHKRMQSRNHLNRLHYQNSGHTVQNIRVHIAIGLVVNHANATGSL